MIELFYATYDFFFKVKDDNDWFFSFFCCCGIFKWKQKSASNHNIDSSMESYVFTF